GDFTLKFDNPDGGQVVIDDVIWTAFEDDGGGGGNDGGDCGLVTDWPDEIDDGWGNLHMLEVANDFVVPANNDFSMTAFSFNALIEPGMDINSVDLHFYEDTGNGPGDEVADAMTGLAPSSIDDLGDAQGYDRVTVHLDFDDPVDFEGNSIETVYWIGVQIDYDGDSSYMEIIHDLNTPNEAYMYDDGSGSFVPGSVLL